MTTPGQAASLEDQIDQWRSHLRRRQATRAVDVVGLAYAGGRWGQAGGRMDVIRFSGEFFIYYALIALGGGVLTAFMAMIFQAIGVDVDGSPS